MSWNYRVVEHEDYGVKVYGLHKVYYDESGGIRSWNAEPSIVCDTENFSDFIEKLEAATKKDTLRFNASGGIK